MDLITAIAVAVQCGVLAILLWRLRGKALAKLGFLCMASTFVYHGFTEIVQAIFPEHDAYRLDTTPESLHQFLLTMTAAMVLFTTAYLFKLHRHKERYQVPELLSNLRGAYLLRWPILLGIGLLGMVITTLEKGASSGSFAIGLADQFTILLLAVSLTTAGLVTHRRWHLIIFAAFGVLTAASGARGQIMMTTLMALSAMVRYGVRISKRAIFAVTVIVAIAFVAISMTRGVYGRFANESILERLKIISESIGPSEGFNSVLEDSVYRSDANSYGAMIIEKQSEGYGITGFPQLLGTVEYCIPSFVFRGKLNLDDYQRNEEGYQDRFFGLAEDIDYISDFWSLLIGYGGITGLLLVAPLLGWSYALLDNWLARSVSIAAYLSGIGLSMIAIVLELGVAGIPYTVRGLVAFIAVSKAVTLPGQFKHSTKRERALAIAG